MKRSPRPRNTTKFSDTVRRQLNLYALAAGAAGVGTLGLTQSAEAKIVYTPVSLRLSPNTFFKLDLNHDGTRDFTLNNFCTGSSVGMSLLWSPSNSNGILGKNHKASALPAGIRIGPGGPFSNLNQSMALWSSFYDRFFGQWANSGQGVRNRYLGLKFLIKGKAHFGWARLTVKFRREFKHPCFIAALTGYAYETIPNKAIITGKTKGPGDIRPNPAATVPTREPATLGLLAMGSQGLHTWRRESVKLFTVKRLE